MKQSFSLFLILFLLSIAAHRTLFKNAFKEHSKNNPLVRIQGLLQSKFKPGAWLEFARKKHCSKHYVWHIDAKNEKVLLSRIHKAFVNSDHIPQKPQKTIYGWKVEGLRYTKRWGWLDVGTLKIYTQEKDHGKVKVEAFSVSTGVVPASVFLAPILNILFFWVPFFDFGVNDKHLSMIELSLKLLD